MASTPIRRCSMPGCDNEISPRSNLSECKTCRAYLIRYLTTRPAVVLERRRKIHLYDSRLQVIMPGDPETLTEQAKMVPPAHYKPQGKRGKRIVKQSPPRLAQSKHSDTHRTASA